jgi:hypothetical protein
LSSCQIPSRPRPEAPQLLVHLSELALPLQEEEEQLQGGLVASATKNRIVKKKERIKFFDVRNVYHH